MSWIRRLFRVSSETEVEVHPVTGTPPVDSTYGTFQPDRVAVWFVDGRFHEMRIGGPGPADLGLRCERTYRRVKDVPEWARCYTVLSQTGGGG